MELGIERYIKESNGVIVIDEKKNSSTALISYTPVDALVNGDKIEVLALSKGDQHVAVLISSLLYQANQLIDDNNKMDLKQMKAVSIELRNTAWNMSIQELSNTIKNGINGHYGNFYKLSITTIGTWIKKYLSVEREQAHKDKVYYREQRRSNDASELYGGEGWTAERLKQFREALKPRKAPIRKL